MDRQEIEKILGESWVDVVNLIKGSLSSDIPLLNKTNEALLSNSGKMLRPAASLLISRMCAGKEEMNADGLKCAAASELLHNATLFHDDVADDSDQRRGRPTIKKLLGDRASVLMGDFWLVKAVQLILSCDDNRETFIRMYSKTLNDLAEGELLQLDKAAECDTTEEDYLKIIYSKTASLFECACLSAAISQGAEKKYQDAAEEFGRTIGLAFQIKDDIMDYAADASIGKPVGIDIKEKKITLPLLEALSQVDQNRQKEIRELVAEADVIPENCDRIREFVTGQNGVERAKERLAEYIKKARASLDIFEDTPEKDVLLAVTDYIADREI